MTNISETGNVGRQRIEWVHEHQEIFGAIRSRAYDGEMSFKSSDWKRYVENGGRIGDSVENWHLQYFSDLVNTGHLSIGTRIREDGEHEVVFRQVKERFEHGRSELR